MGWRYRKRIKILPGIHINISKSGISTNIGVKGANVSFGPKGTYVNTGFPGTGLYRRDKIAEYKKKSQNSAFQSVFLLSLFFIPHFACHLFWFFLYGIFEYVCMLFIYWSDSTNMLFCYQILLLNSL